MEEATTVEELAAPDSNILKARLLLTKPANLDETEDSPTTAQEVDLSDSSDVMFVSALSLSATAAEDSSSNPLCSEKPSEELINNSSQATKTEMGGKSSFRTFT